MRRCWRRRLLVLRLGRIRLASKGKSAEAKENGDEEKSEEGRKAGGLKQALPYKP